MPDPAITWFFIVRGLSLSSSLLLLIRHSVSGHGSQKPDQNDDEKDGKDEGTIVVHNREHDLSSVTSHLACRCGTRRRSI